MVMKKTLDTEYKMTILNRRVKGNVNRRYMFERKLYAKEVKENYYESANDLPLFIY